VAQFLANFWHDPIVRTGLLRPPPKSEREMINRKAAELAMVGRDDGLLQRQSAVPGVNA
jgi:hypothetical protein